MNSRTDEIQCCVLLHKLRTVGVEICKRKRLQRLYDIKLSKAVKTLKWNNLAVPSFVSSFSR